MATITRGGGGAGRGKDTSVNSRSAVGDGLWGERCDLELSEFFDKIL